MDPRRILECLPTLYADGRGEPALRMDVLCRIVEKQINWNYKDHLENGVDSNGPSASPPPCNDEEISFMITNFFTVRPYRPHSDDFVRGVHAKNWILCTFHLYSMFDRFGPFQTPYRVQNEWVNEVFMCCAHLSPEMDSYCCGLIDLMMRCWRLKALTKYKFTDIAKLWQFRSFNLLQHCLGEKQYLRWFRTTAKNNKFGH